jgi:hypothetical protein
MESDSQEAAAELSALLSEDPWPSTVEALRRLQAIYTPLADEFNRRYALLNEQVSALREEASKLEDEIRKLRTGDREVSYEGAAPQASQLKRLLRAELGLASEEVIFLCTVLNIPNHEWQDAVEGLLGQNRFTILVPPAAYNAAMRLMTPPKTACMVLLFGYQSILNNRSARSQPDSWRARWLQSPAACVCGFTPGTGQVRYARRPSFIVRRSLAFVRRNFTDSHLTPRCTAAVYRRARHPRQIESRQACLDEIAAQMQTLNSLDGRLRQLRALTGKSSLINLEHT